MKTGGKTVYDSRLYFCVRFPDGHIVCQSKRISKALMSEPGVEVARKHKSLIKGLKYLREQGWLLREAIDHFKSLGLM